MSKPVLRFPAARLGCRVMRGDLPDDFLEWGPMEDWMDIHLATCLACQADFGPGRLVGEFMATLADDPVVRAPAGFVDDVMGRLGGPTDSELRRRRSTIGWSAGAVSAAALTTVLLVLRRGRMAGAH